MKKVCFLFLLILSVFLSGCDNETLKYTPDPNETEPNAVYNWMAGESPVPNRRMGIVRVGVNNVAHAVSPDGVYFMSIDNYILFMENGSDSLIKLCGRPDCEHNSTDCNAYVDNGSKITYYQGYLYAMAGDGSEEEASLIRMDPDGSNRVEVLDLLAFAKENGGDYIRCNLITDGVCIFQTVQWVEFDPGNGGTGIKGEAMDSYIYRLDGSMDKPVLQQSSGVLYNCGDIILSYSLETRNGGEYGSYWSWDPMTEEVTYLTDHPGVPGYFDETEGYYFKDGAVRRITYATQEEEIMVETGLEGTYVMMSFPECFLLACRSDDDSADNNLYFYNWAFELMDTVTIDYPHKNRTECLIIAETAERIILSDGGPTPLHYIDKSELGTDDLKIHAFKQA